MRWATQILPALFIGVACLGAPPKTPGAAEPLVADLSSHLIAITTGFHGTNVLLFGATDGEGDVVVVVRGPEQSVAVRRKDRVIGIWVNRDEMEFENVPTFFHLAGNRPLRAFAPNTLRSRHQLGVGYLKLTPVVTGMSEEEIKRRTLTFRSALINGMRRLGRYGEEEGKVDFLGNRLFRTNVHFPANVPTGTYLVEVFLIRDGQVAGAQTTPLVISKVGLGAEIFDFAHRHEALYGILSVCLALLAGWLAAVVFRRG